MKIEIKNFKNLSHLEYSISDNKINFLFGMSGAGKSSILEALAGDNPVDYKTFGSASSDSVEIKVDGKKMSPVDTHIFDIGKMNFILESQDVEEFKEIVVSDPKEHKRIHDALEKKIKKVSDAIRDEMSIYEEYGTLLDGLKARKLTKDGKLPTSSPIAKTMSKLRAAKDKRVFRNITSIDPKTLEWIFKGIGYIKDDNCPFCDKKMSKKKIKKLNKMAEFDSKAIGSIKEQIETHTTILGTISSYEYIEMKKIEKQIIQYSKSIRMFDDILIQIHNAFELNFDPLKFASVTLDSSFKNMFPKTYKSYSSLCSDIPALQNAIKNTQQETDAFLKGKKKIINDILDELNIPYAFDVQYHRAGPNEYSIIHKKDPSHNDDKKHMSTGEKAIISLIIFLISSKSTNYKIYIIDDPVSSFDNYRRKLIFDYILEYLQGKTTLILSHYTVVSKFAIANSKRKVIGDISYLSNNGENKAIINSIKTVPIVSFQKSVALQFDHAANQYQTALLARYLFEEEYGKNNPKYTYLSKIIHGYTYVDIQNWLLRKGVSESSLVNMINADLADKGVKKNLLTCLNPNYNINIDIANYSIFEKCIICRELVNKGLFPVSTPISNELNNSVHLNGIFTICLNVFEFPVISRTLLDVINTLPTIVSLI